MRMNLIIETKNAMLTFELQYGLLGVIREWLVKLMNFGKKLKQEISKYS